MSRRHFVSQAAAFATLSLTLPRLRAADAVPLSEELETIRREHQLPALAALAWKDGAIVDQAAVGVRKQGETFPVTTEDKFHIGSITKSMTATLAAMFVEQGKIRWDTTIGEHFTDLSASMKPVWREVTLTQLLGHRGGAPHDVPPDLWGQCWQMTGPTPAHRMLLVRGTLSRDPEAPPGTKYIYSNTGYAIAGAMLERIAGEPWEKAISEQLFQPLKMTSAGFGAPATPGKIDQPWGHVFKDKTVKAISPGRTGDNPAAIGPAGIVHCSLADLARHADLHLRGARSDTPLLKKASFTKLHQPLDGQDYALGWTVVQRPWAGGVALNHTGSNTMFYVNLWLAPARNAAFIAATNIAGDGVFEATDQVMGKLIGRHLRG